MNIAALKQRKVDHQKRVDFYSDRIAVTEKRLENMRQLMQIEVGNMQAITKIIADEEVKSPAPADADTNPALPTD